MKHHELKSSPETIRWGAFDATFEPVLTIDPGDFVSIEALNGGADIVPEDPRFEKLADMRAVHEKCEPLMRGHILTGPVAVAGAKAGQVLEVKIQDVRLRQNWGWSYVRPGFGALPEAVNELKLHHIELDGERQLGLFPWGGAVPLAPFFGVMGVAPPPATGRISSIAPGDFGGNLDIKVLGPGATLYLPIFNDGALFSVGDGHAAQGDGEVSITAIETALGGTFQLNLRDDLALERPRAETREHLIAIGIHEDLNEAVRIALRDMTAWLNEIKGLSLDQALSLCSIAGDLHVSQVVNINKGTHMMLPKAVLPKSS